MVSALSLLSQQERFGCIQWKALSYRLPCVGLNRTCTDPRWYFEVNGNLAHRVRSELSGGVPGSPLIRSRSDKSRGDYLGRKGSDQIDLGLNFTIYLIYYLQTTARAEYLALIGMVFLDSFPLLQDFTRILSISETYIFLYIVDRWTINRRRASHYRTSIQLLHSTSPSKLFLVSKA